MGWNESVAHLINVLNEVIAASMRHPANLEWVG
jgi:hypothetical protein